MPKYKFELGDKVKVFYTGELPRTMAAKRLHGKVLTIKKRDTLSNGDVWYDFAEKYTGGIYEKELKMAHRHKVGDMVRVVKIEEDYSGPTKIGDIGKVVALETYEYDYLVDFNKGGEEGYHEWELEAAESFDIPADMTVNVMRQIEQKQYVVKFYSPGSIAAFNLTDEMLRDGVPIDFKSLPIKVRDAWYVMRIVSDGPSRKAFWETV